MKAIRILSTKKLLVNQKHYLLNAGLAVVEADFISVSLKAFEIDTANENLIFTSQNAVISFLHNGKSAQLKEKGIFCVGIKTKAALEHYGFKVKVCTDYAEKLADIIIKEYSGESFTFFSGSMRRDTLPQALANAKIDCNEIEVYKTVLSPHKINSRLDGILFYSPSGVQSYLKENDISNAVCFCIGTTTTEALKGITENIVIANKPTLENVIVQCINYYKERI